MEAKREAGRAGGIEGAEKELQLQSLIDDFLSVSKSRSGEFVRTPYWSFQPAAK